MLLLRISNDAELLLDSIADLQRLPAIFKSRGYSDEDVANVMHGNFVRFLREALPQGR